MRWVVGALLLAGLSLSGAGTEALEIRIRGESSLEVETRSAGTTLVVEGRLVDDRGVGLPLEEVSVVVRTRSGALRASGETDYAGFFSVPLELPPGHVQISTSFVGGPHLEGARAEAAATLTVQPAELAVRGPAWTHGARAEAPLEIRAHAGGQGLPAPVTVTVDGRPVQTLELDAQGQGRFDVGPFLRGGVQEVGVHLAETTHRPGVSQVVTVQWVDALRVHGQAEQVVRRAAEGLEVVIALSDGTHPVEGAEVVVRLEPEEGGERLERRLRTDERGRGDLFVGRRELGESRWALTAEVRPPMGAVVEWDGGLVMFVPNPWIGRLSFVGALGILLGLLWLARRPIWVRWDLLMEGLRGRGQGDEEAAPPSFERHQEVEFGFAPVVNLPRRSDSEEGEEGRVWVQVWDPFGGRSVAGATLRLVGGELGESAEEPWLTDEDGLIELLADLPGGALEILADGYVPARARLPLPRGRRAVRVDLTAVPIQIRRMYRWMLAETSGGDLWGVRTPREIRDELGGAEIPGWEDLLDRVTELVEETNFSGQRYDLEWWERARGLLQGMVEEARRSP